MTVLVSDFDGVICNGLAEYFHSSKLVYQELWSSSADLDSFKPQFNVLRPIIETGWEMPLLLKALVEGQRVETISNNWSFLKKEMVNALDSEKINAQILIELLDQVRQTQINENLNRWLELHSFYDGMIAKLRRIIQDEKKLYIITTKEGRFTRILLEKQGIKLPAHVIFGKEVKRPKYETLRLIIQKEKISPTQICFIEDRLEALESVSQQQDLVGIRLYLAMWGYNTRSTKTEATKNPQVHLLSLANFTGNDVF